MLSLALLLLSAPSPALAADSAGEQKVLQAGAAASAAAPTDGADADTKLSVFGAGGYTSRLGNKHKVDVYDLPWCEDVSGFDAGTECDRYGVDGDKHDSDPTADGSHCVRDAHTAGKACWQCEACVINRVGLAYGLTLLSFFGLLAFVLWGVNKAAQDRAAAEGLPSK